MKIQQDDPFCEIKITALKNKRKEGLEAVGGFKKKQKGLKSKRSIKDYMKRHDKAEKIIKLKLCLILMKTAQIVLNQLHQKKFNS